MAVMNGFRKELFAKILGLNGHVIVIARSTADFHGYEDYAKKLANAAAVKHVVPLIEGQVIASVPSQSLGANVRGISEDGLKALPLVADNIRVGTLDNFGAQDGIALGIGFALSLRVNVGDSVTLISPRGAHRRSAACRA